MKQTVAKWGNSLALRIPASAARDAGLADGSPVEIEVRQGSLIVTPRRTKPTLAELLADYRPEHRHGETDWGARRGSEEW